MPKLSIVTINYNNFSGLEKTFNSIFAQTYKNFEYIVIDGGSTDGSKDLIERYSEKITYWVSETDNGIYNAINKGIEASNGEYLFFLNSGDFLFSDDTLLEFNKNANEDILYGDIKKLKSKYQLDDEIKKLPYDLSFNFFYKDTLPHQSCFIKKNLFTKYGLYDEQLKITADWAFLILAICKYQCSYKHLEKTISCYDTTGISSQPELFIEHTKERLIILERHFKLFLNDYKSYNEMSHIAQFKSYKNLKFIIENSNVGHKLLNYFSSMVKFLLS
ncbi:glycosyltransferase family 2 protein [Pedobacter sp.]|uniref:glycosyltransferase family 2 protein n=1 Tax=Pedobacter sp. TaxID=1411316 RepID=UPI0031DB3867